MPNAIQAICRIVCWRFPEVPQISIGDLHRDWTSESGPKPLLLDVRTAAEFAVSHLPGAVRIDPGAEADLVASLMRPGVRTVVYCSVGYRSSQLAARLIRAGHGPIANLEGSIFEWANHGFPLEADGQPVRRVHCYQRKYRRMLNPAKVEAVW